MADSEDFFVLARCIELCTSLNELQSRGLVRRLLKQAGLDSHDVTASQLSIVGKTLLSEALKKNGIAEPSEVVARWLEACDRQVAQLRASERMKVSNTVEEVFARMGLRR